MLSATFLEGDKVKTSTLDKLGKGTVWIHCFKPSEEDLKVVEEVTGIEYDNLSVALDEEIHPYAEKDGHIELVYRAPVMEPGGDTVTAPLIIFVKGRFIVTLTAEKLKVITDVQARFAKHKSKFLLRGKPAAFVIYLLDAINDHFLRGIEKITNTIDLLEQDPEDERHYEDLYNASLTSAHFNRALLGNIEALNVLRKLYHRALDDDDRDAFNDLYLDALQILDTEKIQRELITNLFTFQNVLANQKVEKKLRRLTVLAIIIAVPTMFSGLYGMNLAHLPLADHPQAFWIMSAFMLASVLILIVIFKVFDW